MEKKVIVSEKSPAAIGPYSQAIEYNGLIYTSGVIGVNPATGEVGATIEEQTTQVFENLKGLLADAGSSLDQAIKTTVFIKNMDDFGISKEQIENYRFHIKFAALLHDVGHAPLSHLGESFYDKEEIYKSLIENLSSEKEADKISA